MGIDIETRIQAWAQSQPSVIAVVVVGSRARTAHPADEWSDLDLCLFVTNAEQFVTSDFYRLFGQVWLAALDSAGVGEPEWVVMYEGGMKVDFTFITADMTAPTLADAMFRSQHVTTFSRGARSIVDKYPRRDRTLPPMPSKPLPTEAELGHTVSAFLMQASRAVKFIRRGDHWRASTTTMCKMRPRLMQMIEWHARAHRSAEIDTWYDGRFIDEWADPRVVAALRDIYADDDPTHRAKAALAHITLFCWLAEETAAKLGYKLPDYHEALNWIESVGKRLMIVPTETQISAGGVVYRDNGGVIEVALVRAGDRWQLPKGIIESGEATEATARREVREEAGIDADVIGLIDRIEYWYYTSIGRGKKRIHKFVFFYLMRYLSGDPADHDHEVDEAGWFPLDQVETMVPFRGEAAILAKAKEMLTTENAET
jgi:aminoglycoside 6-adenylyltransferase